MGPNESVPFLYALIGEFSPEEEPMAKIVTSKKKETKSCQILGDFPKNHQSLRDTCQSIVEKIHPGEEQRKMIRHKEYCFHILVKNEIVFLCLSSRDTKLRVANSILDRIEERWKQEGRPKKRGQIKSILRKEMDFANNGTLDRIEEAKRNMDDVKESMLRNIDLALNRGEDLDVLLQNSDDVLDSAEGFKGVSLKIKRRMQMRLCMMICGIISLICVVVIVALVVVFAAACTISNRSCWDILDPKKG